MSWFAGSADDERALFAAKTEVDMYQDLFTKLGDICFAKCVPKYKDADLSIGEMACTDRCVAKYMEAQEKVGVVLKNYNDKMAQQQQALQGMQGGK